MGSFTTRVRILTMIMVCSLFPWIPCRATIGGIPPLTFRPEQPSSLESNYNHCLLIQRGGGAATDDSDFGSNSTVHTHRRNQILPSTTAIKDTLSPWRRSANSIMDTSIQQTSTSGRRHQRLLQYRDILNCDSRQWTWTGDGARDQENGDSPNNESTRRLRERRDLVDESYVDYRGRLEGTSRKLHHSPVVYQYYGRSRIRGNPSDSVHFILLGPNVDHWKAVGQVLASRGFNTIACERLKGEQKTGPEKYDRKTEDAPNLVLEVMEALKWKKVIIVGCDSESILAMETAMMLSPDQVVGLVLAGDLAGSNQVAAASGVGELDSFLQRVLECPFLIIWDGDSPTVVSGSSAHKAVETDSSDRCVILGGGSAPHRLKPEQFAWILTRFVEERLEISTPNDLRTTKPRPRGGTGVADENLTPLENFLRMINLPFGINALVSPEGRLLLGRAIAAGLFYITAMRVIVIQYGILRAGLIAIKSRYESIDALTKRSIQAVGSFIINFGYIPRLFTVKRANEEDDDRRSGTIVLETPREEGEEGPAGVVESFDETLDTQEEASDPNEESKPPRQDESDETSKPKDENERPPIFKPFFFLDNVVT